MQLPQSAVNVTGGVVQLSRRWKGCKKGEKGVLTFLLFVHSEFNYCRVLASAWPHRAFLYYYIVRQYYTAPHNLPITDPKCYDLLYAVCFDCLRIFIIPKLPAFENEVWSCETEYSGTYLDFES